MSEIYKISEVNLKKLKYDYFLLDTNVLLWTFSFMANDNDKRHCLFSNFISGLISTNKKLIVSSFNISEAFHVIEKSKRKIYNEKNNLNLTLKSYRTITDERKSVQNEIDLFYNQIQNIEQIDIIWDNYNEKILSSFVSTFYEINMDFYDFNLCCYSREKNNIPIVTFDNDLKYNKFDIPIFTI